MAMMGQPPVNMIPIYPPTTTPPVDPYYQWNHYTMQYEYQPRSMLTHCCDIDQTESVVPNAAATADPAIQPHGDNQIQTTQNIANNDLAQLIFDAGKFYLSHSKSNFMQEAG